jgi:hypothetical protein
LAPGRYPSETSPDEPEPDLDETCDALGHFGLRTHGPAGEAERDAELHLWPENWPVWCLWRDLETQWRVGLQGPTGLDYPGAWTLIEQRIKRRRERREVFWLLQGMEEAILQEWRERAAH